MTWRARCPAVGPFGPVDEGYAICQLERGHAGEHRGSRRAPRYWYIPDEDERMVEACAAGGFEGARHEQRDQPTKAWGDLTEEQRVAICEEAEAIISRGPSTGLAFERVVLAVYRALQDI